jgi:hypothetical protein
MVRASLHVDYHYHYSHGYCQVVLYVDRHSRWIQAMCSLAEMGKKNALPWLTMSQRHPQKEDGPIIGAFQTVFTEDRSRFVWSIWVGAQLTFCEMRTRLRASLSAALTRRNFFGASKRQFIPKVVHATQVLMREAATRPGFSPNFTRSFNSASRISFLNPGYLQYGLQYEPYRKGFGCVKE